MMFRKVLTSERMEKHHREMDLRRRGIRQYLAATEEEEKDKEGEDEDDGVVVSRRTSGLLPEDRPCNWIERVFTLLEHPDYDRPAKIAGYVIMSVILLSSLAFIVGTLPRFSRILPERCVRPLCVPGPGSVCTRLVCPPVDAEALAIIEAVTVAIFTVEYLIRVALVGFVRNRLITRDIQDYGALEPSAWRKVARYVIQPLNLIDLAAIVPYYAHMILLAEHKDGRLGIFRLLRLAKVFRVLKMVRYTEGGYLVVDTLRHSAPALVLLLLMTLTLTTVFGTMVYFFEGGVFKVTAEHPEGAYYRPRANGDGEEVSPFTSIVLATYWVVMTATTVGYGDFYPTTTGGRFISVCCAFSGIVLIAMPMTIISNNFNDAYLCDRVRRRTEARLRKHFKTLRQQLKRYGGGEREEDVDARQNRDAEAGQPKAAPSSLPRPPSLSASCPTPYNTVRSMSDLLPPHTSPISPTPDLTDAPGTEALIALCEEETPTTSLVDMIQEQLAAAAAMQEQLARLELSNRALLQRLQEQGALAGFE